MADAIDILAEAIAGIDTAVHKLKHELLEEPEDDGTHERVRGLLVDMTIWLSQLTRVGEEIDALARQLANENDLLAACRTDLGPLTRKLLEQQQEIERLRAERDEARREWCRLWGHTQGRNVAPTQAARLRAWDCFLSKVADTK